MVGMDIHDSGMSATADFWNKSVRVRLEPFDRLSVNSAATPAVLKEAWASAQCEIDALSTCISRVRSTQNTLVPVGWLPKEILAHTFRLLSYDSLPEKLPSGLNLGWISVTHVCREWREAALQNATLWGSISFDIGMKWAEEMLRRAKDSPVDLSIVLPTHQAMLVGHIYHVRKLHMHTFGIPPATLAALCDPAPMLEDLLFSPHHVCVPGASTKLLPFDLFAGYVPRLRNLSLYASFPISWSMIPSGIVSLVLRGGSFRPPRLPYESYTSFIDVLSRSRCLESLEIVQYFDIPFSEGSPQRPNVFLSHLKSLIINDNAAFIKHFLISLRLPSSAYLSVKCFENVGSHCHLERALQHAFSCLLHPEEPMTTLAFCLLPWAVWMDSTRKSGSKPAIHLRWDINYSRGEGLADASRTLLSGLDLCSLEVLQLQDCWDETLPSILTDVFSAARRVKRVEVDGYVARYVFTALATSLEHPSNTGHSTAVLFPSLHSLVLKSVNFDANLNDHFAEMLSVRAASSAVPKDLVLQNCIATQKWIDRWAECVPGVAAGWDRDSWTIHAPGSGPDFGFM